MAGRDSGGTSGVGKIGRPRQEERQRKLITDGKIGEKKVTFRLEEEVSGRKEREKWKEECREIIGEEVRGGEGGKKSIEGGNQGIDKGIDRIK